MVMRNCSQIWGSSIKKPENQALKVCYVLNFRLNSNVPMVVLGENLRSRQVALVSGYEKLQSDMGVIY